MVNIGLPTSYWQSCPPKNGVHSPRFSQVLLSCSMQCHLWVSPHTNSRCAQALLSVSQSISRFPSGNNILSPAAALNEALLRHDLHVWCPQQSMFINHRIKGHQGSQRALLMIQLEPAPWPNATYKPMHGQTLCGMQWLHHMRDAWFTYLSWHREYWK